MHETYTTLVPLNRILKLYALNCIHIQNGNLTSRWPTFRVILSLILMTILNIFLFFVKSQSFDYSQKTYMDLVQFTYILGFISFIVDLNFVRKYGQKKCVQYYMHYEKIDKVINLKNHGDIRKKIIKLIVSFLSITIVTSAFDYMSLMTLFSDYADAIHAYLIEYFFYIIKVLTVLDTVSQIYQIQFRLSQIGKLIRNFSGVNKKISNWMNQNLAQKKPFAIMRVVNDEFEEEFEWLSKCYLMLLEQNEYINKAYGIRMLLSNITFLMDSIDFLNLGIRYAFEVKYNHPYLLSISSFMRLFNSAAVLIILMDSSEKCYRQHEYIVDAVDRILILKKNGNEKARANLKEFRDLLITREIKFHAANFYRLDYSVLASITSVVFTYTIIFLQNM